MLVPVFQLAIVILLDGNAVKIERKVLQFVQTTKISIFMAENADQRVFRFGQSEQSVLLGYGIDQVWLVHLLKLQGLHINDKAVSDIALLHPVKGRMDIFDVNELNVRDNSVFRTKIQHLLCFRQAACAGSGNHLVACSQ